MPNKSLPNADREFLRFVREAAFANPFSETREVLDRTIAEVPRTTKILKEDLLERTVASVRTRLAAIHPRSALLSDYTDEDRRLVSLALLFEIFHQHAPAMDRLIEAQMKQGDVPVAVPYASELLAALTAAGFAGALAARYLAIFYQLRRAYFFIGNGLIGASPCMNRMRAEVWNNVFTVRSYWYDLYLWDCMEDFSTLLLGPTGVGKSRVAAAIGRSGFIPFDEKAMTFVESFTKAFVSINLSQYPETLIDSELFGHSRGAFTGAIQNHDGVFARCSPHGAIFLDEIGDVSLPLQVKLLGILQDRTFTPVGSHSPRRFDGRVIAATNQPIDELRRRGTFRDDFYYRLCSHVIPLPSLKERLAEHPAELDELLAAILENMIGSAPSEVVAEVREALEASLPKNYEWPGNVRELEQAVRRTLLTGRYGGDALAGIAPTGDLIDDVAALGMTAEELMQAYCKAMYRRHSNYEEVARRLNLDRRTVKRYVT